jgi:hypothetical protein
MVLAALSFHVLLQDLVTRILVKQFVKTASNSSLKQQTVTKRFCVPYIVKFQTEPLRLFGPVAEIQNICLFYWRV